MRLVEKKCPNCGANLEFSDTDKSCKCTYCHRAFEIERDQEETSNLNFNQQFTLNEISKSFTIIPIVFVIIFILASSIIGFVIYSMYQSQKSTLDSFDSEFFEKSNEKEDEGDGLYSDTSELTNTDFESMDNDSIFSIPSRAEGVNDAYHSYSKDGKAKRQKVYVAYKSGSNFIIAMYQVTFKDFFHQENRFTFYVPIVYENVKKNGFVKFDNPQNKAPEYYFNDDHSSYSYGYGSMDDAYNNVVKPLIDQGYSITEK